MTASGSGGGDGQPVPDDPRALARDIEQTREALGETVAALAAKTDVKARAAGKARELTGRFTSRAHHGSERAFGRAGQARGQLAGQAERGRTLLAAAPPAGQHARQQAVSRLAATAAPARRTGQRAVAVVRRHPVPAALAVTALLLAALAAARARRS